MTLKDNFNNLQSCQRLYEEYIVAQYTKVESHHLGYVRTNQDKLRSQSLRGLQDAVQGGDLDPNQIGRRVILPASFIGGRKDMMQKYHDGMAIIRKRGKADAFITMTANPRWKEVQDALLPGQTTDDRLDIVTRVFNLKLKKLMQDLTTEGGLRRVVGYMHVIEFQKRGLPHAHILIIFADDDKLKTPDDYDDLICAKIRDPIKDHELYQIISNCNMHGPCGSLNPKCACMQEGVCKNGYPEKFREETMDNDNGYPLYRRRNYGRTVRTPSRIILDNSSVVP